MMIIRRVNNIVAVSGSYFLSRLINRPIHRGMPLAVSIEPTNYCNLRCPQCPSGTGELTRPRGYMDFQFFKSILDQLAPSLLYLTLYFEGEPYLHPEIFEMIRYARQKGVFVAISTNGHFLTESNAIRTIDSDLSRLIVSVDGADQSSYEKYRVGGNLQKVLNGIQTIVNAKNRLKKRNPEIILQTLLLQTTEHEIEAIKKTGKRIGVDKIIFKTAQFYDFRNGNDLMPRDPALSRYQKKTNGEFLIRNSLKNHCFRMWSSCVITWDGNVVPCCFDKDAKYAFGNLKQENFVTIWKGTEAEKFRKMIVNQRKTIDICTNCTQSF